EGVQDNELTGEVALYEEVLVGGLDAGRGGGDVGDRRGGGDGEHVAVAHAVLGDLGADRGPVHLAATGDFDGHAAFVFQDVNGVLREESAVPFGAFVGGVGAALGGEVGGGFVGVVGDGFHGFVVEVRGFGGGEGDAFEVERVGEAHDAHADGAVAAVGGLGGLGGVEVDVDDVVERTHGELDGLA